VIDLQRRLAADHDEREQQHDPDGCEHGGEQLLREGRIEP